MLTFQNLYEEAQTQAEDNSSDSLVLIKRAINQGQEKFAAVINREYLTDDYTFSITADQQYYYLPADCIRPQTVVITIGSRQYPLIEIADEQEWNRLNVYALTETSDIPTHFFVKGDNRIGIYPVPSTTVSNAGTLTYEKRLRRMTQADVTANDGVVTNGDATFTSAGATFTDEFIGRSLIILDGGTQSGIAYKILSINSTTSLELEKTYDGPTGTGKTYVIGEVSNIPSEYHESLVDYALHRYYLRRRDYSVAGDLKRLFDEAIRDCKAQYSSSTSSQYVRVNRSSGSLYMHNRQDYKVV